MVFRFRTQLLGCFVLLTCLLAPATSADEDHHVHSFKKFTLTREFFAEGAHFADFNQDGKMDVAYGPHWYEGPDFTSKHEYFAAKAFDPKGYSNAFLMFTADFNQDEWSDILVVGWPGKEAFWYENPKDKNAKEGHWKRHVAFDSVDNESPGFGDVTGDGRPELVFHTRKRLGYAEPNWDNPTLPWTFHPISALGDWQRYTHGFGFGDVNGDGRADIVLREGWWEQPASAGSDAAWKYHQANFGGGGAQMYAYDVDGDGDNDVVTSLQAHGYGLAWFENIKDKDGNITFKQHLIIGSKPEDSPYGVKFSQPHAVNLVDFDGDGLKDIVTGKRYWAHGPKGDAEPGAPAVLYWFKLTRGDDGVHYVPYRIDDDSGVGTQFATGDVSGNGLVDVVIGNKKGAFVFLHEAKKVGEQEWQKAQPKRTAGQ